MPDSSEPVRPDSEAPRLTSQLRAAAIGAPAVVLAVATLLWGGQDYLHHRRDSDRLREEMLEERKRELVREADQAVALIENRRVTLENRTRRELWQKVDEACGLARALYEQYRDAPEADVARIIRTSLSPTYWNTGTGSFFVLDRSGTMVVEPLIPERESVDYGAVVTADGTPVAEKMIGVAEAAGAGFVSYRSGEAVDTGGGVDTLARVRTFEPLGWIIGANVRRDEMTHRMKQETMKDLAAEHADDANSYTFVLDYDGTPLVHPARSEVHTERLLQQTDENGTSLADRLIAAAKAPDGGFVRYSWEKPSLGRPVAKLSYVRGMSKSGWVVGRGIYLDDIAAAVNARREDIIDEFAVRVGLMLAATVLLTALSVSLSHRFSEGLVHEFESFQASLAGFARDREPMSPDRFTHAELQTIAVAVNAMQRQLRDSEARYRTVFENTGTAMCMVASDGTLLLVNDEFARHTGCSKQEIEGNWTFADIVAPHDRERLRRHHIARRTAGADVPKHYEADYVDGDGRLRHALVTVEMIPGTTTSVASLLDITERKQAEDQLRTLTAVVEQSDVAITMMDTDFRIEYMNAAAEWLFGWQLDEIRGKRAKEVFRAAEAPEKDEDGCRQTVAVGETCTGEQLNRRRDGSTFWCEFKVFPIIDASGEITRYGVFQQDITRRHRHEQRLCQVNECFLGFGPEPTENIQRLVDLCGEVLDADWAAYVRLDDGELHPVAGWQVPEGLESPTDPRGLVCGRVISADGDDVVGLTDLVESPFAESDPNVRDLGARSYLGRSVRSHAGTAGAVCAFYREDHRPIEEDEQLIGIMAAAIRVEEERREVRDQREQALTDLKVANRDLELARSEAEEANRLKSEFLANTSHEIRTPLNGIIGYLQLVLNDLCDGPKEEREFVAGAHESAQHLLALINDVLDVAKIEAGKLSVTPEAVSVAAVLADIHSLVRVQAEQNNLELVFHPVSDDLTAWCDEERLKQVLINLLGNAVKFTPEGGTVTVSVDSIEEEGNTRFEVVDTGIGLTPGKLDTIFEKFVQGDGSTTRRRGGSGLGLTISQRLVEMMGGTITAHSDGEGCGSTFSFTIPLHRADAQRDWTAPLYEMPDTLDPERAPVLVVEDDPLYREYLCELLESLGCQTMWAATADDALTVLERHTPDAITLDYSLPAREGARLNTGWDLLVEVHKDERLSQTAVILITGDTGAIERKIASQELPGRVRVLKKTNVPDDLAGAIEQAVTETARDRPARILLADDDPTFCTVVGRMLEGQGYELHRVPDGADCLDYLKEHSDELDLLLLDLRMPGVDGYEVLRELRRRDDTAKLPVLVVTAYGEPDSLEHRMLLAGGGRTRMLTKHEVLTQPSRFHGLVEQFVETPRDPGGQGDIDEIPPEAV